MRLTDRARAAELKAIIDRMEAGGFEVAEENRIYVKLAEYENAEEDAEEGKNENRRFEKAPRESREN